MPPRPGRRGRRSQPRRDRSRDRDRGGEATRAASRRDRRAVLRPVFVLVALLPVLALLVTRIGRLPDAPILGAYSVLSIGTTALVLFLAFARYGTRA